MYLLNNNNICCAKDDTNKVIMQTPKGENIIYNTYTYTLYMYCSKYIMNIINKCVHSSIEKVVEYMNNHFTEKKI